MSFDSGLVVIMEVVCAVAKANFAEMFTPVAAITPAPPFTGVAEQGPAFEFVKKLFGYSFESTFGTTSPKVVGPAPDDGIEFAD